MFVKTLFVTFIKINVLKYIHNISQYGIFFIRRSDTITENSNNFLNELDVSEKTKKDKKDNKTENTITEEILHDIEEELIEENGEEILEYDEDIDGDDSESDDESSEEFDDDLDDEPESQEIQKKPSPSIDKILKETSNSAYFNDDLKSQLFYIEKVRGVDYIKLTKEADDEVFRLVREFNDAYSPLTEEEKSIQIYYLIAEITDDYVNRKKEILESYETNDIYKKFFLYKQVLQIKRKPYVDKLASENMRTVYYVVKKFGGNIDKDELIDVGFTGYAKALDKYSPAKGVKFATFAIHCIYNEILFQLRKDKKVRDNSVSINTKLSTDKNGNDLVMEDVIADNKPTPEEVVQNDDAKQTMLTMLRNLNPTERYIITYRFGIDRGIMLTQKDIAQQLDMSQANISKIEKNSLEKLNELLRNQPDFE